MDTVRYLTSPRLVECLAMYLSSDFMPCMHKNTWEVIKYRRCNIPVYIYIYIYNIPMYIYIRHITWVSVKYDEIFHECHEPKASGNTKYE